MKVGILAWDLNISGGTQRQALELAIYLQKQPGQKVIVYTYFYDPERCYPHLCEKLDIRYVCKRSLGAYPGRMKDVWLTFKKYVKFYFEVDQKKLLNLLDNDIDVLNVHDYHVYPTAGLWKAKTNRSVVWMMNDIPIYRWNPAKVMKTVLFHIKPKFRKYIESFDKIVVLDHLNKKQVLSNFRRDAEVVRSGIDIHRFPFVRRDFKTRSICLLSIGIFLEHRRIEDTVNAVSILAKNGCSVVWNHVGSDDRGMGYARRIYTMVERLGLSDKVVFHRRVSEQELLQLFHDANLFIFPNSPQTWGLSVFEAMACGLPVIATTGCGASEILTDGENAMIVEPNNPVRIAQAIERLQKNQDLYSRISREGRRFVETALSWDIYGESMLRVFSRAFTKT